MSCKALVLYFDYLARLDLSALGTISLKPLRPLRHFLELNISHVLDKSGLRWYILLLLCQFQVEVTMCRTIKSHAFDLAIRLTLIRIEKSAAPRTLE